MFFTSKFHLLAIPPRPCKIRRINKSRFRKMQGTRAVDRLNAFEKMLSSPPVGLHPIQGDRALENCAALALGKLKNPLCQFFGHGSGGQTN